MDKTNFCKNCIYFRPAYISQAGWAHSRYCRPPKEVDYVNGGRALQTPSILNMYGKCKYFEVKPEPKKGIIKRMLKR